MPARTHNESERWQKMHVIMCWPKPSHASKDIRFISTCFDQNSSYVSEGTKLTSTCVDQTYPMPERTQTGTHHVLNKHNIYQRGQKNESQHVLTNPIPCQRGIIMNQSDDGKCMSTCVEQNPLMPARTKSASQLVLTKTLLCQRRHKINLNTCWPNLSHAWEDSNWNSSCVKQT